jgi:hypothetical protein
MKCQWHVHREAVERLDGRQRWDRAYQSILRWSLENERARAPGAAPPDGWSQVAAEWRRLHDLRTLFAVLGYALLLLGAAIPNGRRSGS